MSAVRTGYLPAPGLDYERGARYAERFDLDFVEVYAEGDPWRDGVVADPESAREYREEYDLDLLAHLPFPLDVGSPIPEVREGALEALDRYVAEAAARGVEKGTLHLSVVSARAANEDDADALPRLIDAADEAATIGRDHGVEVCVENLFGHVAGMETLERVLDETDASMTLDTGHAILDGWTEAEIAEFVADHPDRVSHVHCNDNRATNPNVGDHDEHLPFGTGTVDFETILEPLETTDWEPTLSMEILTWDERNVGESARRLREIVGE